MDERGTEQFDLLLRLAGLDQKDFTAALDQAIKDGYVTKPEFERFVHVMNERLDGQDELLMLKVENVELKLQATQRDGFDKYIEDKLPAAIAQHHKDQRTGLMNWIKQRSSTLTSIFLLLAAIAGWWTAWQTTSEVRDLKRAVTAVELIDDALN